MKLQVRNICRNHFLEHSAGLPLATKLLSAILGVIAIRGIFRSLERLVPAHFGYASMRYRIRKLVALASYVAVFLFLAILFKDRLRQASLALGVLGAGTAVALQDGIASIGGWFAISFSSLYSVGDRIQVGESKGDVIDISPLRTTIMETGNWVSGDLYNGRVVRIPNNAILKNHVSNYSQGSRFVRDEIKVRFSARSDHLYAKAMLSRIAKETVGGYLEEAHESWKRIAENHRLENPHLEPSVTLVVSGSCLEFSVSYLVDYAKRTEVKDQLFTKLVEEIVNSNGRLEWASSEIAAIPRAPSFGNTEPSHTLSSTSG